MPEMITVRCPRCGKKLLFSPFDNYKKATLECPGCHYTGLVETYPEISDSSQRQGQSSHSSLAAAASSGARNPRVQNQSGTRNLDSASTRTRQQSAANSTNNNTPTGFALKFPWVIAGLALAIIILYVCLQCLSTNEVI